MADLEEDINCRIVKFWEISTEKGASGTCVSLGKTHKTTCAVDQHLFIPRGNASLPGKRRHGINATTQALVTCVSITDKDREERRTRKESDCRIPACRIPRRELAQIMCQTRISLALLPCGEPPQAVFDGSAGQVHADPERRVGGRGRVAQ